MAVISFLLAASSDLSDQERVLGQLRRTHGVRGVGRIDPDSRDSEISRMCFAETDNADAVQLVVAQLQRDSEVENVSVEPRRGLVG